MYEKDQELRKQAEVLATRDELQREQEEVTMNYRNMKNLLAESNVRPCLRPCVRAY